MTQNACRSLGAFNCEKAPVAGDPFEVVLPAVGEADTRAEDQHLHRAGDQDLASLSEGSRSGANVHRQAGDGPAPAFDLAGVQAGPDLEPDLLDRVPDRAGAPDRPSGPVENGKNPSPAVSTSQPR